MIKAFVSIVFLILATVSFAQNKVDANGKKQGEWSKVYPGTRVYVYKGQFKDDKPVGQFTYYYKSAKVRAVIEHEEGSNRSECYYYHEGGGVMSYGIFRDQKRDSIWVNVDKRGKIRSKESYHKDSLHGIKVVYYLQTDEFPKSRPSSVFYYDMGKLHGDYKELFESGKTKVKGKYDQGQKVGEWVYNNPSGRKHSLVRYKEGVKHGWCIAYDEGKETSKKYYYYGRHLDGKQLKKKMEEMKRLGINPNE